MICDECRKWKDPLYWSHGPGRRFYFLNVLLDDFSDKLEIPQNFTHHIVGDCCESVFLRAPGGSIWDVQLKKTGGRYFFGVGWHEFVKHHRLNERDFLVFRYDGASRFSVQIFDNTGCERGDAFFVQNFKKFNDNARQLKVRQTEEDIEISIPDGNRGCRSSKFRGQYDSEGSVTTLVTSLPSRGTDRYSQHCSDRFPRQQNLSTQSEDLRNVFSVTSFPNCATGTFKMMENKGEAVSRGKDFNPELKSSYPYPLTRKIPDESSELNHARTAVHFRSLNFNVANKDVQHDFMQIPHDGSFISPLGGSTNPLLEVTPIQCVPAVSCNKEKKGTASSSNGETPLSSVSPDHISAKTGSASEQKILSVPSSKRKSNDRSNKRSKLAVVKPEAGCLEITKSGQAGVTTKQSTYTRAYISSRRPVTDEEKTRAKESALAFQSVYPFFVVVMKTTFVSRGFYMHIPLKFVKAHLPQQDAKFTLQCVGGKEWQVSYLYKEGRTGFLGGWADFVYNNNLEEGDACVFELIKGEKEWVMNVTIFRVVEEVSPLAKRHFVQPPRESPRLPSSKKRGAPSPGIQIE